MRSLLVGMFTLAACSAPSVIDGGTAGGSGVMAGGVSGSAGGGSGGSAGGASGGSSAGGASGGSAGGAGGIAGGASGGASAGGASGGGSTGVDGGWLRLAPGTSWQWQLTGTIDLTVDAGVFDIDLFEAPQATIDALHASGRKVICYFDTAYEPNRPDSTQLAPYRGNPVQGWPGQFWLDFRQPVVRTVMSGRLDLAVTKRCDAVEPDDVDAIDNTPGFPLTANDQLDFIRFLARKGHARGLAVALKNDLAQVPQLVGDVDFAVNEECFQYNECTELQPFITAGKAVLQVEYTAGNLDTKAATICPQANARNFDTLIKHLDLDAPRRSCR